MKPKKPNHYAHRQCAHAVLVRTAPHNPVLAQCRRQPTDQHPHSPYVVNVASSPACPFFSLCADVHRPVAIVDWRN